MLNIKYDDIGLRQGDHFRLSRSVTIQRDECHLCQLVKCRITSATVYYHRTHGNEWWRHEMETFQHYWPISTGHRRQKGTVRRSFDTYPLFLPEQSVEKLSGRWFELLMWRHCSEISFRIIITVMSYERYGVSDHRPIECLFDGLFGLTLEKHLNQN